MNYKTTQKAYQNLKTKADSLEWIIMIQLK